MSLVQVIEINRLHGVTRTFAGEPSERRLGHDEIG